MFKHPFGSGLPDRNRACKRTRLADKDRSGLANSHTKGLPQYLLIAETIRSWIQTGRYKAGDSISTIDELAAEFEVAKGTVQEALRHLSEDEIIISSRGRRSKVGKVPQIRPVFGAIEARDSLLIERVGKSRNKVLTSKAIKPDADLAKRLGLAKDQLLIESTLLLYLNNQPNTYAIVYTDGGTKKAPLPPAELGDAPIDIADAIKQAKRAERRVSATSADLELCGLLKVPVGSPILRYSSAMWGAKGKFLLYLNEFLRCDGCEYNIDI
jgi:GntR family transcriptional regulator